ncbi:glycosyltransferase family 39 protein [Peterkaempfera sp. SMS 1(5)a]|uniref:glycosyltransferase family 39 protein n=1 Tax=Peterkaempfera podocarpi TaxID=3232308 RepID=UPI00366F0691
MTTPGTRTPGLPSPRTAEVSAGPAHPASARKRPGPAARALGLLVPLLPAAAMLGLGLWQLDARGPWRDEAATYEVAIRSWGQIWELLHHVDAVHGLYYLLMHGVFLVFGPGLTALRMPSVIAMAVAAGGVALIGRRLVGPAVGVTAGLLLAVTPFVSKYAQEGRSYALVTAGVVITCLLLLRAWERPTWPRWAAYGAMVLLVGLLHEFALLIVVAHGATVLLTRGSGRRVRLGWLAAAAGAGLCAVPLALFTSTQSAQVDWLPPVTWQTPWSLLQSFAGPEQAALITLLVLAGLGALVPRRRPGAPTPLLLLALPWLLLPPALLMTASLNTPLYYDRYVLYSVPGLVLLAAAGLDSAVRGVGRLVAGVPRARGTAVLTAVATVLGVALAGGVLSLEMSSQRFERTSMARADDLRAAAETFKLSARPGDAVVFSPANRRAMEKLYPEAFHGTVDVLLERSAVASASLTGEEVEPTRIEGLLPAYARVWVVAARGRYATFSNATELLKVLHTHYRLAEQTGVRGFAIQLWIHR